MAIIAPKGWRLPTIVPTRVRVDDIDFKMSFGHINKKYLPASEFQIWSPTNNCSLSVPWSSRTAGDVLSGAISGGVGGAIGAVTEIGLISNEPQTITYGIASSKGLGPTVGYCIDDAFSERTYYQINAIKNEIDGSVLVNGIIEDVRQQYSFEQFLLWFGTVKYVNDGEGVESFSVDAFFSGNYFNSSEPGTVFVYTNDGGVPAITSVSYKNFHSVLGFKVSDGKALKGIKAGDFWFLSTPILINDPYLMAGIWTGFKNDIGLSWAELPTTSNQKFATKAKIVGGYALFSNDDKPLAGGVGMSMETTSATKWKWWLKQAEPESSGYLDAKERPAVEYTYEKSQLDNNTESKDIKIEDYIPKISLREKCTKDDVLFGVTSGQTKHVRIEISEGGSFYLNNFHSPCLNNGVVRVGGNWFKILAQIDAVTIDVSYLAVDGETTFNMDAEEVLILTTKAWKIISHKTSGQKGDYATGTIKSSGNRHVELTCPTGVGTSFASSGTMDSAQGKNELEYLQENSFHERFKTKAKEFSGNKGGEWRLVPTDKSLPILNVSELSGVNDISNSDSEDSFDIQYSFVLDYDQTITEGAEYHIEFGPGVQAPSFSTLRQEPSTSVICLYGEMDSGIRKNPIPQNSILGICDSYAWGIGQTITPGYGTPFFISTPGGMMSLSSFFADVPDKECLVYAENVMGKPRLKARYGSLNFSEYPVCELIAHGEFKTSTAFNSSPITLQQNSNSGKEVILHSVNIELTEEAKDGKTGFVTFSLDDKSNVFGPTIAGDGETNLLGLEYTDVKKSDKIKAGDKYVSPIYFYKKFFNSASAKKLIHLSNDQKETTLHILNSINGTEEAQVKGEANYISTESAPSTNSAFDVFMMPDGEQILFYDYDFSGSFVIGDKTYNSGVAGANQLSYSTSAINAIGKHGYLWGTPFLHDSPTTKYSSPIMIANNCQYLCSTFAEHNNKFYIFAKCFNDNGLPFIGCFVIGRNLLWIGEKEKTEKKGLEMLSGERSGSEEDTFWFRPLKIGDKLKKSDETYTAVSNIISGVSGDPDTDEFSRVYGAKETKSKVEGEPFGIFNARMTEEGYVVLFVDTSEGVYFLFSTDGGVNWQKSYTVLTKEGKNGFMIDDTKFYYLLESEGLFEKDIDSTIIYDIIYYTKNPEGNEQAKKELEDKILGITHKPLGTGPLPTQKFCGHVTNTGERKIFFYNQDLAVSCFWYDGNKWGPADNF